MRIHHLDCGTMCPFGGILMDGRTRGLGAASLVCHCLLIEAADGLVLVDTGFGMPDVERPVPRLDGLLLKLIRPRFDASSTALKQLEAKGFKRSDVRHIVLTHLDFDHAGGLADFPEATVHLYRPEAEAARERETAHARSRYRPQQWGDGGRWKEYGAAGEPWFGFEAVRQLEGLPPEILMVPLIGHTWGHCGIAIDRGSEGWLLHAGDAYFYRGQLDPRPRCTPGLIAYQAFMEVDRPQRLRNQKRLRELARSSAGRLEIFCAHDAEELKRLQTAVASAGQGEAP